MDGLEFASRIIGELAWPAVVLYLLRSQRKAVSELIGRVTKVKAGPAELEATKEQAKDAKDDATKLELQPLSAPKSEVIKDYIENIGRPPKWQKAEPTDWLAWYRHVRPTAPLRPRASVIQDWLRVENVLRKLGEMHRLAFWNDASPTIILDALLSQGVMSEQTAKIVVELLELRDRVTRMEYEPPKSISDDFSVACEKVLSRIESEENAWQEEADRIAAIGFGLNS